jgi:hypothetical protein
MPGRPQLTAKKATKLEEAVLAVFRELDAATPAMHKETEPRHGVTAPTSPWVAAYRLGCEFLLAVDELGRQCRKVAGIFQPGPVGQAFNERALVRLRREYQRGGGGRTLEEIAQFKAAAEKVHDGLPNSAEPTEEFTWAIGNQHVQCPDFAKAPSNLAIGFWFALVSGGAGFKRDMYSIFMNKQLPRGDWAVRDEPLDTRTPKDIERELRLHLGEPPMNEAEARNLLLRKMQKGP